MVYWTDDLITLHSSHCSLFVLITVSINENTVSKSPQTALTKSNFKTRVHYIFMILSPICTEYSNTTVVLIQLELLTFFVQFMHNIKEKQ